MTMRLIRPAVIDGELYEVGCVVTVPYVYALQLQDERAGVWCG